MKMRRIDLDDISISDIEEVKTLSDLVGWAQSIVEMVPEEYRAAAHVECYCPADGYPSFSVYYHRPETAQDLEADERKRREWTEMHDARERAEYQRLKARYG